MSDRHEGDGVRVPGPIWSRLSAVIFGRPDRFLRMKNRIILSLGARKRLHREVDRLHRKGEPWPYWPAGRGGAMVPFTTRVDVPEIVAPTARPDHLPYCVRWTGAYWAPCGTPKQRRDAGYVALMMCWPGALPEAGTYLSTGARARFVYRIAEVEAFRPPRGSKRYTCRLWCDRLAPDAVPKTAAVASFYWHPREKKRPAGAGPVGGPENGRRLGLRRGLL